MLPRLFLAGALVATLAAAQSPVLTFTYVPNPITDGQANAITYSTNDTMHPVTITLRKGLNTSLATVGTLTCSALGGQFIWTPPNSLADGSDYALEITQGNQINYFGPFVIQGADANAVASASAASSSLPAPSGCSTTSSSASSSSNTASANGTMTAAGLLPGTTVGSMNGTGTALPRNTTMSMATLTAPSSTPAGTMTGSAGAASSTAASTSAKSGAAVVIREGRSMMALVLGFGAAAAYL